VGLGDNPLDRLPELSIIHLQRNGDMNRTHPGSIALLAGLIVLVFTREAAELLNLSTGAPVSLQLKKLAQATAASRKLRRQIADIEEAIDKEIG